MSEVRDRQEGQPAACGRGEGQRAGAAPGLEELLIAEVTRHAHESAVERIWLKFAAFRAALQLGDRTGAGSVTRRRSRLAARWRAAGSAGSAP